MKLRAWIPICVNVPFGCYADGEASLAVRKELAAGSCERFLGRLYAFLQHPRQQQAADQRSLYRAQAGFCRGWRRREFHPDAGGSAHTTTKSSTTWSASSSCRPAIFPAGAAKRLRMLDQFQMGPNLVRGFAPAGIGPRDLTPGTTNDALGGIALLGCERGSADAVVFPAQGYRHQGCGFRGRRLAVGLSRDRQAGM